jgi:hypothetical protein
MKSLKRLFVVSGVLSFAIATIGAAMIMLGGANAQSSDRGGSLDTANRDNGGPTYKRLGF